MNTPVTRKDGARTRPVKSAVARKANRPRNADATRELLLTTAEVVFTDLGFDGARVDDIAARAKVNKRMIYVYFSDKGGLYAEVLRRAFERIKLRAKVPFDATVDPRQRLGAWICGYFEFLAQHPQLVRLVEWEALADSTRSASTLREVARQELEDLTELLETGVTTGRFRADLDPYRTLMAIHALCFGVLSRRQLWLSLWQLDLEQTRSVTSISKFLSDLVLDGIKTVPPVGTP
jgi:TetR/AcrR family transcriptional regulator